MAHFIDFKSTPDIRLLNLLKAKHSLLFLKVLPHLSFGFLRSIRRSFLGTANEKHYKDALLAKCVTVDWSEHIGFIYEMLDKEVFLNLCTLLNTDEKNKVHQYFAHKEKWSPKKEKLLIEIIAKLLPHSREIRPSDLELLKNDLMQVPTDHSSYLFIMLCKLEERVDVGKINAKLSPIEKLSRLNENSVKILQNCSHKLAAKLVDKGIVGKLNARLENPENELPLKFLSILLNKLDNSSDQNMLDETHPLIRVREMINKDKLVEIMSKQQGASAEISRKIVLEHLDMVEEEEMEAE